MSIIETKKETKSILCLINDTDPILVRVIKNKFKKEADWESIISLNYDEAVALFLENQPDLVLTEIIIGDEKGRTGFDFIEEIKQKDQSKNTNILIFTELSQNDDEEKAKKLGVDYFFIKSKITLSELIEEIKRIIV